MTLELSTRLRGLSTSSASRSSLPGSSAYSKFRAHLCYIDRPSAAGVRSFYGLPEDPNDARKFILKSAQDKTSKLRKNGARFAETLMFTFPNDFDDAAQKETLDLLLKRLCPKGSDIQAFAVCHTDKPNNKHAHILFLNGLESLESARKRSKGARVRRRNALRFNEMGAPKRIRFVVAQSLNQVANSRGLTQVEYRSFKTRGIEKKPSSHDGPVFRARTVKRHLKQGFQFLLDDASQIVSTAHNREL